MQADAGPKLLRDWIARAAAPRSGQAVDRARRRRAHRHLRRAARDDRPHRRAFCTTRGLGANDRVALLANNSIEHLVCYFGVMAYGATICTVHVEMNRNQLDNIFARLKPKLVLHQDGLGLDDLLAAVAGAAPAARALGRRPMRTRSSPRSRAARRATRTTGAGPDDDAVILFTSGTSAQPKGVVLNYREHLSNIDPTADGFGITAERSRLRFPLVQLGLGAAPRRAGAGQSRRHAGHGAEILGQPLLPARARSRRHGRGRQSDHHQHPAQQRAERASRQPAERCASSRRARRR